MKRSTYARSHFTRQHTPRIRSDGRETDGAFDHEADTSTADLWPDLSLLANGDLGWIQVTNLVLTGLLVGAFAVGMRRALSAGLGRTCGPILLGVYGVGLIRAGFFTADPAFGFPPGTEASTHTISWHGLLHIVTAGIGF